MTTPTHNCADFIEVVDTETDKATGHLWQYLRCTVCGKRDGHISQGGSDAFHPVPDNAVFYTDPGWEITS
ncbi:hypothetical protein [Micromonospora sp. C41]|uniref:hypothetical protein n=1 Tax=Micromonospora TaxID=1873 RepID=UPI001B3620AF|nr:hypothetical protein [Micromonospora sp. C41]MBQ1061387.1 hypothetical protein [Micromonospora sp. C41]